MLNVQSSHGSQALDSVALNTKLSHANALRPSSIAALDRYGSFERGGHSFRGSSSVRTVAGNRSFAGLGGSSPGATTLKAVLPPSTLAPSSGVTTLPEVLRVLPHSALYCRSLRATKTNDLKVLSTVAG